MAVRMYPKSSIFSDDQNLGINLTGILGQAAGAGVASGLNLLFGPHADHPHPLTDSGEMAAALDHVWLAVWQPAKTQLPPDQLLQLANQIRAWLYDPTAFGQSGTENDAYLNNSKNVINSEITQIQAQLAASSVPLPGPVQTAIDPATGQTVIIQAPATTIGGFDTTTLLILAGAGVLLIVLSGRS